MVDLILFHSINSMISLNIDLDECHDPCTRKMKTIWFGDSQIKKYLPNEKPVEGVVVAPNAGVDVEP